MNMEEIQGLLKESKSRTDSITDLILNSVQVARDMIDKNIEKLREVAKGGVYFCDKDKKIPFTKGPVVAYLPVDSNRPREIYYLDIEDMRIKKVEDMYGDFTGELYPEYVSLKELFERRLITLPNFEKTINVNVNRLVELIKELEEHIDQLESDLSKYDTL